MFNVSLSDSYNILIALVNGMQNNIKNKINVKRMHLYNQRVFQLNVDFMQCDMLLKNINYILYIYQFIMPRRKIPSLYSISDFSNQHAIKH